MPDYDFSQLSPHDFERLVRDLLQAEWGVVLESFKEGRDGGIDLRYARGGGNLVVQCKRYVASGYAGLLRSTRTEAAKVALLRPSRYVLATAVPLSPANKRELAAVVGPRYLAEPDVLGRDDVNNLLGRHGEVERAHYKLYLASVGVLERVLHGDVASQTEFEVDRIHREVRRYVQGRAYPRARKVLAEDRVVVLSGQPGVGKTTLANLLLYEHLDAGFEPVVIRQDFSEGRRVFQRGRRQVFHFDDFFGVTYLGDRGTSSQRRDHRAVVDFADMVAADGSKRLILTTREHLLSQARDASERLRHSGVLDRRVVVRMGDYGLRERAEILYNHLFFSDLPDEYRDELLRGDFYLRIVKHEKFNPRLIEWLSTHRRVRSTPVTGYQAFVADLLERPTEIWRHAYEHQISHAGRTLLLGLHSLGGTATAALVEEAFSSLHARRAAEYGFERGPEDFAAACAELHGAFVRPKHAGSIEFINPSVIDWLNGLLLASPTNALDVAMGASRFSQIETLWRFSHGRPGDAIRAALRGIDAIFPARVVALAVAPRKLMPPGGTGMIAPGYEKRLTVMIGMAADLRSPGWTGAIRRVAGHLVDHWTRERAEIEDGADLIRAVDAARDGLDLPEGFRRTCIERMIASANAGCGSDDLRALATLLEGERRREPIGILLSDALGTYRAEHFEDELSNCRSGQDFAALRDDLDAFARLFDIDLGREVNQLDERQHEFDEYQEMRADQAMDEHKDHMAEMRGDDDEIRSIFGSMRRGD